MILIYITRDILVHSYLCILYKFYILEFYYTYVNILYVKIVLYSKLYGQEQNLSSSLFTELLVITKLFIEKTYLDIFYNQI